uniref:Fibrous sheath-interacting protein 1 n=1 Tax=Globisporangium ultimum (strain ATCC 200006 / CBS 805.95 / DAOM BR144) TaxID=431595 RepID=K3WTU3_GLOUD
MEQNANASLPFASDSAAPCVDDDDDEYMRSLEVRKKLQNAEDERERLRDELQSYVTSLTSRKGDDGAQWLEFPKNYEHVLSLMSERDLRDEVAVSSNSGLTSVSNSSQRSWSHVLLQTGLAKQQAFGTLTDDDNENDAKSSLAAKIALKMARVRQLDAILEEKLGKHLYSASSGRQGSKFGAKKPKPVAPPSVQVRNQEPEPSATRGGGIGKTFAAQPNPNSSGGGLQHQQSDISITSASRQEEQPVIGTKPQNGSNFVERNKKVIACGMRPVLSQDEETRLNRLLCDVDTDATASTSSMESPSVAKLDRTTVEERNEFAMSASEKKRIEELIVEKRGAYQSNLLVPFDDDGNDDSDIITDTPAAAASNSNTVNIIQATKKERLRKQRLDHIDQELAFLNQSGGCLTIVADDDEAEAFILNDGETDSVFDGTMSERSYRTTTSTATSVYSLRSGVISRRQFNEFLVAETRKLSSATGTNDSTPNKASPEEIQRLVSSLSHLMTSRPVA